MTAAGGHIKRDHMRSVETRFWAKVDITTLVDCWNWTAYINPKGYGQFKPYPKSSPMTASRMAWTLTHGDPGELFVLHWCDNRPCCNPGHLFLGTHEDNMADMAAKGRSPRGGFTGPRSRPSTGNRSRRKLSDRQIMDVRKRHDDGESIRSIARAVGIHHSNVLRLVNGTHWRGYLPAWQDLGLGELRLPSRSASPAAERLWTSGEILKSNDRPI